MQEICAERDFIQAQHDAIKRQIDLAKRSAASGGERADPVWLTAAESAYRRKGRRIQSLNSEMGLIRQEAKRTNCTLSNAQQASFARVFMKNAKQLLAADVYLMLIAETQNDVSEGGEV